MNGYVDLFFMNALSYLNLLWEAEIIKYLLSFLLIFCILGTLKKLLQINK